MGICWRHENRTTRIISLLDETEEQITAFPPPLPHKAPLCLRGGGYSHYPTGDSRKPAFKPLALWGWCRSVSHLRIESFDVKHVVPVSEVTRDI
jgi:hypothetical protein